MKSFFLFCLLLGALQPSDVVIQRGDAAVTVQDVDAAVLSIPETERGAVMDDPRRASQILEGLALRRMVAADALAADIDQRAEVQAALAAAEQKTLAAAYLDSRLSSLEMPDFAEQARDYYAANADEFVIDRRVQVRQIFVSEQQHGASQAAERGQTVADRAKAGEAFEVLAREFTDTRQIGAGIRSYYSDDLPADTFDKLWAAEPGTIVGPVRGAQGYAIFELVQAIEQQDIPFEDARGPLVEKLEANYRKTEAAALLEQYPSEEELAEQAREQGLATDPIVRRRIVQEREKVLSRVLIEEHVAREMPADLEPLARERYRIEKERFSLPATITVRHVLVSSEERSDEEALALAQQVEERARTGDDFAVLVTEFSDDPSAADNGGRYEKVTRGQFVKAFENAAFALEPGEISEPVETRFGYHVILLEEKTEARQASFDEVREQLVDRLRREQAKQLRALFLEQYRSQPLTADRELLEALRTRYL